MSAPINTLRDLLLHELSDLLSAEQQIIDAMPALIKASNATSVGQALEGHLTETRQHVRRLEQCFTNLGETPHSEPCAAMRGILVEAKKLVGGRIAAEVVDAALISACQRIEHYEIAAYGCAKTFCDILGEGECADILRQTLSEESEVDKKLTNLATTAVNRRAQAASAAF